MLFRGGVPTGPDVAKLMALDVGPGANIPYAEVEELLGLSREDSRFTTVTNAWRARLFREHRWRLKRDGQAFHIYTPDEAVGAITEDLHAIGRKAGRTVVHTEAIDATALSPTKKEQHRLQRRYAQAVLASVQEACLAIAPPQPAGEDVPLRLPPRE